MSLCGWNASVGAERATVLRCRLCFPAPCFGRNADRLGNDDAGSELLKASFSACSAHSFVRVAFLRVCVCVCGDVVPLRQFVQARLRRWSEPTATLRDLVTKLLDTVSLLPHMHTFVGGAFRRGLSGGQKKRLAIAIELVREACSELWTFLLLFIGRVPDFHSVHTFRNVHPRSCVDQVCFFWTSPLAV